MSKGLHHCVSFQVSMKNALVIIDNLSFLFPDLYAVRWEVNEVNLRYSFTFEFRLCINRIDALRKFCDFITELCDVSVSDLDKESE